VKTHNESVHGNATYSCDRCKYKAKQKGQLKILRESVHGNVMYYCDQCEYETRRKGYLKRHIQSIHENVGYPCDQCEYKAKQNDYLKRHIESTPVINVNIKNNNVDLKRHIKSIHGMLTTKSIPSRNVLSETNARSRLTKTHGMKFIFSFNSFLFSCLDSRCTFRCTFSKKHFVTFIT